MDLDINNLILVLIFIITVSILAYRLQNAEKTITSLKREFSGYNLIQEFRNGQRTSRYIVNEDNETKIDRLGINRKFQVAMEDFHIFYDLDTNEVLGAGEFGVVYKGNILVDGSWNPAAIKTTKSSESSTQEKSINLELKLLSYVGEHPNVVKLLGCCCIGKGPTYIAVEFCELGSLESYIRKISISNTPFNDFGAKINKKSENGNYESLDQLILWSLQIAKGMNYLAKKKIIHSDLATRNILLNKDKSIRITDFGLSRRLYDDNIYVKKSSEPLPWRWMAYEALRERTYSSQSDVWSYGITLWEIFNLGEVPYAGMSWGQNFLKDLENGIRLDKPDLCPLNIYDQIQLCWKLDPSSRSTFVDIEEFFNFIVGSDDNSNFYSDIENFVRKLPYDKGYELEPENIKFEMMISPGIYGTFFYGKIYNCGIWQDATIKSTILPPHQRRIATTLGILKLMIYAGHHPNVVRLLGACTEKVNEGSLSIATEHCIYGSLDQYMRNCAYLEKEDDNVVNDILSEDKINQKSKFRLSRLYFSKQKNSKGKLESSKTQIVSKILMNDWALQIANGMKYLATKKIIHSSLCPKNILVAKDKTLRITNFGISYHQSHKTVPPYINNWKYMSPEILSDNLYSTSGDVWAYGITLSKIYSLGTPLYQSRNYDPMFHLTLKAGTREPCPRYASNSIYKKMLECWNIEPKDRPSFNHLHEFFNTAQTKDKLGIVYINDV